VKERLALAKKALKPVKRINAISLVSNNIPPLDSPEQARPLLVPYSYPLAVDKKY